MKFFSRILLIAAVLSQTAVYAGAYTIVDTYVGGNPTRSDYYGKDVIGDTNIYGISQMNVSVSGSAMTVDIYSAFFNKMNTNTINSHGTRMGDLFISTSGWNPNTEKPSYAADTINTTNTTWDYAVVLDNHSQSTTGGSVSLYERTDGTVVTSNVYGDSHPGWIYRKDQMYRFTPADYNAALAYGSWYITDIAGTSFDKLSLTFDISDLQESRTSLNWAFHWTMSCGNDVIEGEAPIPNPEPSTFLLTGLGILGVAYLRRRRKQ